MSASSSFARAGALACAVMLVAPAAGAAPPAPPAPPTKEACVDAHAKGQDDREAGRLTEAGRRFLLCADAACPDLVRDDCARFADEVERIQPTVTFAARDGAQRDLIDTSVYVDGALVASRLGDGGAREIDPGRHTVRFVHAGQATVVEVVVSQGEKGRTLVGTFAGPPATPGASPAPGPATNAPETRRPAGPLVFVGLGAAAAAVGGAILGVGLARMPSVCSLSTHQCAAPPGDPAFDDAAGAVTLMNVGAIVGGVGVLALGGSLIGYFVQPRQPRRPSATIAPWVGRGLGGLSVAVSM